MNSIIRTPKLHILWFFFVIIFIYLLADYQNFNFQLLISIFLQITLLYSMFYIYEKFGQIVIRHYILPTFLKFKKYNLSLSFRKPTFDYSVKECNVLMFEIYLHNEYFKQDFKYIDNLNEDIRYKVNNIWKHTLLYLNKFKTFIMYVLLFCFFFGLLLLLLTITSYSLIDWSSQINLHKQLYVFFTFIVFSFWLYITIQILTSETMVQKTIGYNRYDMYAIYYNTIARDYDKDKKSSEIIKKYVEISSSILYVSFLAILGIIF